VRGPGISNGISNGISGTASSKNFTMLFHAADWLPTFMQIAGLSPSIAAGIDGISQWPALTSGVDDSAAMKSARALSAERVIVHKMSSKFGPTGEILAATFRVGALKLIVGFPGDDKSTFGAHGEKCTGGCWCPPPDPSTGVRSCVGPTQPPVLTRQQRVSTRISNKRISNKRISNKRGGALLDGPDQTDVVALTKDPPSASCAAACKATGCAMAGTASRCAECLLEYNTNHSGVLASAGCRVPPNGKDLKHWCNGSVRPPLPTPAPGPPPPAPPSPLPTPLPCMASPCLFNITVRTSCLTPHASHLMLGARLSMCLLTAGPCSDHVHPPL
jgi:hypothetical protein